jgi:N-methylhydantoinase A
MANAIREISIERGYDPSDFVLFAFGGAGPMHATQIADEIGMREILIPILPGNLSALGLLASDQTYERVQTFLARLSTLDPAVLGAALDEHVRRGREALRQRGFKDDAMRFQHALDMRYARQAFELTVDILDAVRTPAELRTIFLETYARHFGRADPAGEIEVVNLRTTSIGVTDKPAFPPVRGTPQRNAGAMTARRTLVVDGAALEAAVYARERLPVETAFDGPAIVEEDGATTVVLPGWRARRDATGNLRLNASIA